MRKRFMRKRLFPDLTKERFINRDGPKPDTVLENINSS